MFCEKIVEGLLIVYSLEAFCTNLQGVCVCLSVCVCESENVSEWGWVGGWVRVVASKYYQIYFFDN